MMLLLSEILAGVLASIAVSSGTSAMFGVRIDATRRAVTAVPVRIGIGLKIRVSSAVECA
jgi:hypothetical protein